MPTEDGVCDGKKGHVGGEQVGGEQRVSAGESGIDLNELGKGLPQVVVYEAVGLMMPIKLCVPSMSNEMLSRRG